MLAWIQLINFVFTRHHFLAKARSVLRTTWLTPYLLQSSALDIAMYLSLFYHLSDRASELLDLLARRGILLFTLPGMRAILTVFSNDLDKLLYNLLLIHTPMVAELPWKALACPSGATWGSASCSRTLHNTFSLPTHQILTLGQWPYASNYDTLGTPLVSGTVCQIFWSLHACSVFSNKLPK